MAESSWFVTGGTSGIGRALVEAAVANGERVVFTGRDAARAGAFATALGPAAQGIALDLADLAAAAHAAPWVEQADVLVNCAGQSLLGAIEEADDTEIAQLFEVNLFGALRLVRAALPGMRARGHGWIVNIGSIAARRAPAGSGLYAASKAALRAASEALADEVRPFGIRVMVVEPGAFRTGIAGPGRVEMRRRLPFYDQTAGQRRDAVRALDGKQDGDPRRAAEAIRLAMAAADPPACLVLGDAAHRRAVALARASLDDLGTWESVSRATGFDPAGD